MLRQSTHPLQELCLLCLLFLLWPDLREKVAQQQCWKMIWILKISRNLFVVTSSQLMTGPLLSPSTLTTCRLFHVVNFKTDFFSATINECAPFWKRIQRQIRLILHLSYLLYWCQILFLKYASSWVKMMSLKCWKSQFAILSNSKQNSILFIK